MSNFHGGNSRLLIRADARNENPLAAINSAVVNMADSFADFRIRQDARLNSIEQSQHELNRRIELGGLTTYDGPTPGLSTETRAAIVGVLSGKLGSLPSASLTIGDDPSGGYGVIPELDRLIDGTVRRQNALRRLARTVILPRGVGSYQKIIPTRGSGAAWASEVETRTETANPAFGRIEISPVEAYAYVPVSRWLLDDNAVGLEEWLAEDVSSAIFELEGEAFINGNGSKQPRGLLTCSKSSELDDAVRPFGTVAYVPTGVSGGFSGTSASPASSPADVLIDLTLALNAAYRSNAVWVMSSTTAGVARKWKDQDGRYIWQDSLQAGEPALLLGYPVEIDESMPAIGADSLSIAFGDFKRAYYIIDRPGIRLVSDPFTTPGLVKSYWFKRVGGGLADSRAVKFLKFGTS